MLARLRPIVAEEKLKLSVKLVLANVYLVVYQDLKLYWNFVVVLARGMKEETFVS